MTKKKSTTDDKKPKTKKETNDDNLKNDLYEIIGKYIVEPDIESQDFIKKTEEEKFEFLNKQYIILVRMNNIINEKRSSIYSLVENVYEKFKINKSNEENNSDNEISDEDIPKISEDEDEDEEDEKLSDDESVEEKVVKKKNTVKKDKKYKKEKKRNKN